MPALLLLIFLLALVVAALYVFANADPRKLALRARQLVGLVMLAVAIVLAIVGRWALALPLAFLAVSILTRGSIPGFPGSSRKSAGQKSQVRSRYIDMTLDHDSGAMGGTVRAGTFAGRTLDKLGEEELRAFYGEIAGDAESVALLETYLDRRFPGWREQAGGEAEAAGRERKGAASSGPMTEEEARNVLGVGRAASAAEIRAAHRKLMKSLHPDQGGSTWLAARLNEARDLLLKKSPRGRR